MTKKNDRHQVPKTSKKSELIDASTRETLENHIKELEAENEKLTIQMIRQNSNTTSKKTVKLQMLCKKIEQAKCLLD